MQKNTQSPKTSNMAFQEVLVVGCTYRTSYIFLQPTKVGGSFLTEIKPEPVHHQQPTLPQPLQPTLLTTTTTTGESRTQTPPPNLHHHTHSPATGSSNKENQQSNDQEHMSKIFSPLKFLTTLDAPDPHCTEADSSLVKCKGTNTSTIALRILSFGVQYSCMTFIFVPKGLVFMRR